MDFEIVASRVVLLNDGLMVLVTVPNEYYQVVMNERKSVEIKAVPEPGIVIIRVGRVVVRLTQEYSSMLWRQGRYLSICLIMTAM